MTTNGELEKLRRRLAREQARKQHYKAALERIAKSDPNLPLPSRFVIIAREALKL